MEYPEKVYSLYWLGLAEHVILQECSLSSATGSQCLKHFFFPNHKLESVGPDLGPCAQEDVICALLGELGYLAWLWDHWPFVDFHISGIPLGQWLVCSRHLLLVHLYNLAWYRGDLLYGFHCLVFAARSWLLLIESLVNCHQV